MNKTIFYENLNAQLIGLLDQEYDFIANLANTSALLAMNIENINWVGFYLYKKNELILGPFQGKVACMHIAMGKGVCGFCAESGCIQRIDDVHMFPGHIACDSESKSEIVIPMYQGTKLVGVLDIDSPICARFDQNDEVGLQKIVHNLEKAFQ